MAKQRIMVALQDREHVNSLVRLACQTTEGTQAEIVVLHIVEVGPGLPLDAEADVLDQPGKELLAQAQQFAKSQCVRQIATQLVRARQPGPAIVWEAEDQRVDLLILGCHGKKSYVAKVFIGSTMEYVIAHAPCRVIVEVIPASLRQGVAA
jgi:nucleotide-binding universal stress UspA family protein